MLTENAKEPVADHREAPTTTVDFTTGVDKSPGSETIADKSPALINEPSIREDDFVLVNQRSGNGVSDDAQPKQSLKQPRNHSSSKAGWSYLLVLTAGVFIGVCISTAVWRGMTREVPRSGGAPHLDPIDISQPSQAKSAERELETERELSETRARTQQLSTSLEATLAELAEVRQALSELEQIPRMVSGTVVTISQSDTTRCEAKFDYPVQLSAGDTLHVLRQSSDSGEWQQLPGYMRIEVVYKNRVVARGVGMVPRVNDEVWYFGLDERLK